MMSAMRALTVIPDKELENKLEESLEQASVTVVKTDEWNDDLISHRYDVVFIDENILKEQSNLWNVSGTFFIAVARERSYEALRSYLKLGIYDVVVINEEEDRLQDLVKHIKDKIEHGEAASAANDGMMDKGKVCVFYSSKGGAGKTLLSAMTAQCLQTQHDKKVVLIDLNAQFGGIEVTFGLDHPRSYYDLKPVLQELAIHHIKNVAVTHEETGIDIILGPSVPEHAEDIEDELVSRMLRVCKEHYDYVIVDMPSGLSSLSFTGLNEASHIYYVLNPDSLSLRVLKHTLTLFDRFQLGKKQGFSIILNRTDDKDEMTEKDVRKIIDAPLDGVIRSDYYGIQPMLNMGIPFFLSNGKKAKSKVTKDVQRLVSKVLV
ncbi:AAA family ATPase [Evansella clarkii]|uniref:AAA family ATPase n=1 Tax=Evansella clarkii TaxID=79879 RepID=UPI000996CC43|nr:AAA family ATPase [Evansella clarkii]